MGRILLDPVLRIAAWLRRHQKVEPGAAPVRINLGSGPSVTTTGWVNFDASAHLVVRWLPLSLLRLALRLTSIGPGCATALKRERFVFHDVSYGVPLPDASVETVFSSHMLEHLDDASAVAVLNECARVLVPEGVLRVVVPEVPEGVVDEYERAPRYLHSHRSRWTWTKLETAVTDAGFRRVTQLNFQVGQCPDVELLDNRPGSLFVEAHR